MTECKNLINGYQCDKCDTCIQNFEDLVYSKLTLDDACTIISDNDISVEQIGNSDYYKLTDDDGDWDNSYEKSGEELREYAFEMLSIESYCHSCGENFDIDNTRCECCCANMNLKKGCDCEERHEDDT